MSLYEKLNIEGLRAIQKYNTEKFHECFLLTEQLKNKNSLQELSVACLIIIFLDFGIGNFLSYFDEKVY